MFPHQAVAAAIELKSTYFMPIHWGGFTLALHPWDEPVKKSRELAEEIGLKCITPRIGEVLSRFTMDKQFNTWWDKY